MRKNMKQTENAASHWPSFWNEASPESSWIPVPKAKVRWYPAEYPTTTPPVFLGNWGGYGVWTYRSGISLVTRDRIRISHFPLIGLQPRKEGRIWVDGALQVCRTLGLFAERLAAGPYGPLRGLD